VDPTTSWRIGIDADIDSDRHLAAKTLVSTWLVVTRGGRPAAVVGKDDQPTLRRR